MMIVHKCTYDTKLAERRRKGERARCHTLGGLIGSRPRTLAQTGTMHQMVTAQVVTVGDNEGNGTLWRGARRCGLTASILSMLLMECRTDLTQPVADLSAVAVMEHKSAERETVCDGRAWAARNGLPLSLVWRSEGAKRANSRSVSGQLELAHLPSWSLSRQHKLTFLGAHHSNATCSFNFPSSLLAPLGLSK